MPATSRAGLLSARRSASGRAGSPSKSMIIQSLLGAEHLAEMVVAVVPRENSRGGWAAQRVDDVVELRERVHASPARREREGARARIEARRDRSRSANPCSTDRRAPPAQRATSAAVASRGANAGSLRGRRERAMQLRGDRAELPRFRFERIAARTSPSPCVNARARASAWAHPSIAPATSRDSMPATVRSPS